MNIVLLTNIHGVSYCNNCKCKVGGITLMWSKYVNFLILDSNKNMIYFYIMPSNGRFMTTKGCMQMFPYFINTHLPKSKYDHNPILLEFHYDLYQQTKRNPKDNPKIFEIIWTDSPNIKDIISHNWNYHPNKDTKHKLHDTFETLWD